MRLSHGDVADVADVADDCGGADADGVASLALAQVYVETAVNASACNELTVEEQIQAGLI